MAVLAYLWYGAVLMWVPQSAGRSMWYTRVSAPVLCTSNAAWSLFSSLVLCVLPNTLLLPNHRVFQDPESKSFCTLHQSGLYTSQLWCSALLWNTGCKARKHLHRTTSLFLYGQCIEWIEVTNPPTIIIHPASPPLLYWASKPLLAHCFHIAAHGLLSSSSRKLFHWRSNVGRQTCPQKLVETKPEIQECEYWAVGHQVTSNMNVFSYKLMLQWNVLPSLFPREGRATSCLGSCWRLNFCEILSCINTASCLKMNEMASLK